MKQKNFLWSLLAIMMAATLCVGMSSCSKDDDPEPELLVNRTSISIQANGDGDKDITVTANHTDWTASVTEGSLWLRVNKNGQLATVSVDSNPTTQTRNGKIKIAATADASLSYDISVSQAGADGIITVSVSSVEFDPEGGSQTIQVTSNSGWNVSGNQSWLTVNPSFGNVTTSGSEAKTVTLSVGENTTKDARSCTLTFTTSDNKGSASVTVTQKKPTPFILVNGLDSTSLSFSSSSGVNYKQTVKVTSNVSWSINEKNVPEWLHVSPTNGNGEISIDIYPKTDNDADDKARTAQLVLISGDTRATIDVSQETDLDPDAYANPTNIITLYNGIAFDYDFGKTVSYYYRGYMEKSAVASMTDAEIITVLEENFRRYTQSDNEVAVFSGLDEGVKYMVYTVGYNKNGKRGKLIKNEIATKTLQSNEPMAWISDPTYDASYWYWTVEKSATCYSYYMISTQDLDFAIAEDVYQAWMIDYYIRKGWTSEYVNGGDWYSQRTGNIIAVMTWGLDKKENFANKIYWNGGMVSDSAPKKMQRKVANVRTDKNYPILGKGKLTVQKKK